MGVKGRRRGGKRRREEKKGRESLRIPIYVIPQRHVLAGHILYAIPCDPVM
jgi:hypothetical protein